MTGTDLALSDQITYAKAMAEASLLPEAYRKQPANVLIAMQAGDALGITAFQAIQGIDVISGKMSMSAEMMRALVLRDGHMLKVDVLTEKGCRLLAARKDRPEDVQQFDYTWADAERAGLASQPNYKKTPKSMLLARATTLACKAVFPDVIGGFAATEDVEPEVRRVDTARLIPKATPVDPEPVAEDVVEAELVDEPDVVAEVPTDEPQADADGVVIDSDALPY